MRSRPAADPIKFTLDMEELMKDEDVNGQKNR